MSATTLKLMRSGEGHVRSPAYEIVALLLLLSTAPLAAGHVHAVQAPESDRLLIASVGSNSPIAVPRILVAQLQKDLGDDEFVPKTLEGIAGQLTAEKLSLVDPARAVANRRFPRDAEFYWLSGPATYCGSGGCSYQLYWASLSTAASQCLFPTREQGPLAFNAALKVLPRSTNGLFDLSISGATLTFDGQRYVTRAATKP